MSAWPNQSWPNQSWPNQPSSGTGFTDVHGIDSYIYSTRKVIIGENFLVSVRVGGLISVSRKVGKPTGVSTKVGGKQIVE